MGSVNKVILVGNLGRDAELKFTPSGFPISSFSLATTSERAEGATARFAATSSNPWRALPSPSTCRTVCDI